jgi:hypothetical protein
MFTVMSSAEAAPMPPWRTLTESASTSATPDCVRFTVAARIGAIAADGSAAGAAGAVFAGAATMAGAASGAATSGAATSGAAAAGVAGAPRLGRGAAFIFYAGFSLG